MKHQNSKQFGRWGKYTERTKQAPRRSPAANRIYRWNGWIKYHRYGLIETDLSDKILARQVRCRLLQSWLKVGRVMWKKSQILILVQSCNRIIRQCSHTLENPEHYSLSKSLQLTSRVPKCIFPCRHIPWFSQIFTISFPISLSTGAASKVDQFHSSHSHWNSQTHFCFWMWKMSPGFHPNFPLETLLQWTWSNHHKSCQSLSFWRNFSIVIQTSSCPAFPKNPSLSYCDDLNNFRPI